MTSNNKDGSDLGAGSKAAFKAGDKTLSIDKVGGDYGGSKTGMSAEEELISQVARAAEAEAKIKTKTMASSDSAADSGADTAANDTGEGADSGAETGTEAGDDIEARVEDLSDRLSRALAEVENSRRRFERERSDALRYGASRLAMEMFEVADNLRRACGFVSTEAKEGDKNLKNLVIGIEMTEKILGDAFARNGIDVVEPGVGDAFNADEHQAVSEIENGDVGDGCVVEVVLRGYRMGERLLRPAQVITAKSKETQTEADTEGTGKNWRRGRLKIRVYVFCLMEDANRSNLWVARLAHGGRGGFPTPRKSAPRASA